MTISNIKRRAYALFWWNLWAYRSGAGYLCDLGLLKQILCNREKDSVDRLDYHTADNRLNPVFPFRQKIVCQNISFT
jgi:hypothetical protein